MESRPLADTRRIEGLDVLRGLAVFGILVVNVEQMFFPLLMANHPVAMIPGERGVVAAWAFTDALFENKLISIFSLLFGAGFCLQWLRAEDDAPRFRSLYLRRLVGLAAFGIVHALFFYKADVLVVYSLTALVLLPLRGLSTRALALSGSVLIVLTLAWGILINGPDPVESIARKRAVAREIADIRVGGTVSLPRNLITEPNERAELERPDEPVEFTLPMPPRPAILVLEGSDELAQAKVDYAVFTHGPLRAAIYSRVHFLAQLLILYTPLYLLWRTLGLFLLGAAIVKAGVLDSERGNLWRRAAWIGLGLGLPLTIVSTTLHATYYDTQGSIFYAVFALHDVSSLLIAGGLGSVVFLLCRGDSARRSRRALAAVGKTALTNYIGQSVVMSLVATSYGFGLFGDVTRLQILAMALICFAGQLVVSSLWLRSFRMGPLEWLWRSATYSRMLPLRRA